MRFLLLLLVVSAVLLCASSQAGAEPPTPPENLYLTYFDPGFQLVWDESFSAVGVQGYLIYRGTEPDFPISDEYMLEMVPASWISWVDYDADPDWCYYWKVTAIDVLGDESDPSNEVAWEGPASSAHNVSWGRVKSLYR